MKTRKVLAIFVLGLVANITVYAAHEQSSCYDHEKYMFFLHKQSNDTAYRIWACTNDVSLDTFVEYKPLKKEVLDEAWERAQQLINEKNYRYACDILEFLINDREYERTSKKLMDIGALLKEKDTATKNLEGSATWGEKDIARLHDTLSKFLPLAYENYQTFNFEVYAAFLRQYFLLDLKAANDHVVSDALNAGELFARRGLYKDAYRIFSLVIAALTKNDGQGNREVLEKCYQLLKLIIPGIAEANYQVDNLLKGLIREGQAPEDVLLLAQDLVEEAWVTRSDFFYTALSALANYGKEQHCTDKVIEYEKELLQRIFAERPSFNTNNNRCDYAFTCIAFLPTEYAYDVMGSLVPLVETLNGSAAKIAVGKEILDAILSKACADVHFFVNNQEEMASEVLSWAKRRFKDYTGCCFANNLCFDSEQNFEKFIKEHCEDLEMLKKGCFNRKFLLESIEKAIVVSGVEFAIKLAMWMQCDQKHADARDVIQAAYDRLIQEKCLLSADILKKYVEMCPQTDALNNEFSDAYDLDIY